VTTVNKNVFESDFILNQLFLQPLLYYSYKLHILWIQLIALRTYSIVKDTLAFWCDKVFFLYLKIKIFLIFSDGYKPQTENYLQW